MTRFSGLQKMIEKPSCKIRKFSIENINKIFEIEQEAFPKTTYSKEMLLFLADIFPHTFNIIEVNKDIAGYIIFDLRGHIYSTVVHPKYRRKGLGAILLMHAFKCAGKTIWLEVRSKNIVAIKFYKRLGMKIIGKIPDYYGSDDALIMVLNPKNQ